jgi:hypothetical protein
MLTKYTWLPKGMAVVQILYKLFIECDNREKQNK